MWIPDNLMQIIYQIIAAYFEDDRADELTNEPVFTEILQKEAVLASQPTLSRFWNRMDEDTLHSVRSHRSGYERYDLLHPASGHDAV